MTLTLPELLLLMLIAAVVGAIGRRIAGGTRGGLLVSIVVGFVGAVLGPWIAHLSCSPFVKTVRRERIPRVMVYAAASLGSPRLAARFSNGVCHASA